MIDINRLKELDGYVPPDDEAVAEEWKKELWEIRAALPSIIREIEAGRKAVQASNEFRQAFKDDRLNDDFLGNTLERLWDEALSEYRKARGVK